MSTIKSSDEHLTLNADGSSKDIKLQANASEKVIIKSDGKVGIGTSSPSAKTTIKTATNEEDAILIEQSDGADIGSLRINNGSFIIKGKHTSNPVQIQTHDGNEDIEVDPDGFIKFETGGSERMRLTDNGLTFNGDTAAVNALDDYEEGSWTPSYSGSGGSAGSLAHTTQEGYYTKVGRLVTCQYNLTLSNRGSWSGELRLTGLPFDPADTFPAAGSVGVHKVNYAGGSVGSINTYVNPGVSYFRFMYSQDNDSRTFIQVQDCHDDCQINGIISYIV